MIKTFHFISRWENQCKLSIIIGVNSDAREIFQLQRNMMKCRNFLNFAFASMQNVDFFSTFYVDIDANYTNLQKGCISVCGWLMSSHLGDVIFVIVVCLYV